MKKEKQTDIEEYINQSTGEVLSPEMLNKVIMIHTRRQNGSLRIQQNYDYCPTMAEQHTAHLTDINYLMAKFQPDELTAYLTARMAHRQEIIGHDFSTEPNLQGAKNITYQLKKSFDELPDEVKTQFKNHVEFLKFIDNPANAEKMIKLGLMTKKQVQENTINDDLNNDKTKNPEQKTKMETKT